MGYSVTTFCVARFEQQGDDQIHRILRPKGHRERDENPWQFSIRNADASVILEMIEGKVNRFRWGILDLTELQRKCSDVLTLNKAYYEDDRQHRFTRYLEKLLELSRIASECGGTVAYW